MSNHRAPVLILVALALAACQPASQSPAQTQAAQSAFNTAVAAAQTQAAPPPTPVPTVTSEPAAFATLPPDQLDSMTASFQRYLEEALSSCQPPDGSTCEARITQVAFQYYDNGDAAVVDIGIQRSNVTRDGIAGGAVAKALVDIYRSPADSTAAAQQHLLPPQMRLFRIHVYNTLGAKTLLTTGNWEDVLAVARGSLTADEFSERLKYEQSTQ